MIRRNARRALWIGGAALLALGWFVALRPTALGGSATYVTVRGTSMLPTYETGDLIITREARSYRKGEVVAYRVPQDDVGSGVVVVHRIIGGSEADGYVLQGDNNPERDLWYPKDADVVGKAWVRVPKAGLLLATLRSPTMMAALAAAVTAAMVLMPRRRPVSPPVGGLADAPGAAFASMVFGGAVGRPRRLPVAVVRR